MEIHEAEFRKTLATHLRLLANALDDENRATVPVNYHAIRERGQMVVDSINAFLQSLASLE